MRLIFTILGWAIWNIVEWNLTKNQSDDKDEYFDNKRYFRKKVDDWIASAFIAAGMLAIAHYGFGTELMAFVDEQHPPKWSDIHLFGSGFYYEGFKYAIKKFKK